MASFRHTITVRYGECDMQRVVFNANYLAYVDDAVDNWMRAALSARLGGSSDLHSIGFDFMLKKACITWSGPVRFAETLAIDCSVARWGNTSFEVDARGSVGGEERFACAITYVSVDPESQRPVAIPEFAKEALGFTSPN